jgi:RNA polymerase sigma-70 factor, ECF subfamily
VKQFPSRRHDVSEPVITRPSFAEAVAPAAGAFSEIYREHALTVSRWAVRLGGPEIDCEDVVQEVFLTVRRRLPEFRGEAKIATWLFRITERTVANHRRKLRLRRFFATAFGVREATERAVLTPAEVVERREEVAALYRTLDRLPAKYRRVLILFELEGRSTQQIAELLSIKPGTARVWLHRARARFLTVRDKEER